MNIRDSIIRCADAFKQARIGERTIATAAAKDFCNALLSLPPATGNRDIIPKSGLGMGSFADVPWVAILHKKFGGTASEGYYVVYLFSKDSKRVYLALGVAAGSGASRSWKVSDRERVAARASILRAKCADLEKSGFTLSDNLDLASDGWRAGSYATATAAYKMYDLESMPQNDSLELDFVSALEYFTQLVGAGFDLQTLGEKQRPSLLPVSGLSTTLISKPFLILTGPSGTGKTRGAIDLAEAISHEDCRALIAVGADWTDNRHVLGYLNPLQTLDGQANGIPIYETTPILDLILHANHEDHRDKPHVLILDEMNLSHVERYFADFLSAMELKDKRMALKLHSAAAAQTRSGNEVAASIDFPDNLFVIGTVNVDETTYMFSPKVLDRANVIEIHADKTSLEHFLRGTAAGHAPVGAKDYGISFLEAATIIRNEEEEDRIPELPATVRTAAADHLMALFNIMKRGRGEYGFRTGKEVIAYLRTAHFLSGPDAGAKAAWANVGQANAGWVTSLDEQILQKILPKLHGSRSRLAPLLGALATYCASGNEAQAMEHFPQEGSAAKRTLQDARNLTPLKFKKSYEKLSRMIDVLVEEQFVSFIC